MKSKINFLFPTLYITLFWAIIFPFRFFTIGYYHDDWRLVETDFSENGIKFLMNLFGNRPLLGAVHVAGLFLNAQNNSFNAQFYGAVLILATSWMLYFYLSRLSHFCFGISQKTICVLSVFMWMVMPWSLGTFCWYINIPTILSTMGFCLSGFFLLKYWTGDKKSLFIVPIGVLLSSLTYEIFILQFPLLLCFYFLKNDAVKFKKSSDDIKSSKKVFFTSLCTIFLSLVLSYCLRRFGESFGGSVTKSFYHEWYMLFLQNINLKWMQSALGHFQFMIFALLVFMLIFICVYFSKGLASNYKKSLYGISFVCAIGFVVSCVVPALASYALVGSGIFSRTNLGVSFWLTLFVSSFASISYVSKYPKTIFINQGIIVALVLLFLISTFQNLKPWQEVWVKQQNLLSKAERIEFSKFPPNSLIVLDKHIHKDGVTGFGAPWDLNAAMHHLYPSSNHVRFIVANSYWKVEGDGNQVKQHNNINIIFQMETANAFRWSYDSEEIEPLPTGVLVGED